jgi:hypothetical protein
MKNSLEKQAASADLTHAVISIAEFWEKADLTEL